MRVQGQVADQHRPFNFTIEPYFDGGFALNIGFDPGGMDGMVRVGHWPDAAKAREMAQRITSRLLDGATVAWDQ